MTRAHFSFTMLAAALAFIASPARGGGSCAVPPPLTCVSGTIDTCEPASLPRHATVRVRLVEAACDGRPARLVAETIVPQRGCLPSRFSLDLGRAWISPGRAYALEGVVDCDGRSLWATAAPVPVITNGRTAGIGLVLRRIGAGGGHGSNGLLIRGTVDLNDRSAFPRHAAIIVTVRERDAQGRCAVVCSQRIEPRRGCLTVPFELHLAPGTCRDGCTYEVDARLDGRGNTLWSCRPVGLRHGWGRHGGEQRVALMLERNVRFRAEWTLRW